MTDSAFGTPGRFFFNKFTQAQKLLFEEVNDSLIKDDLFTLIVFITILGLEVDYLFFFDLGNCFFHLSSDQNPSWLGYIGDYTTQLN